VIRATASTAEKVLITGVSAVNGIATPVWYKVGGEVFNVRTYPGT
jgi:hypothetical protein